MSEREQINLALFNKTFLVKKNYKGQNRELLECVQKTVFSKHYTVNDIKGIMVVVGAGSFTSTRIACVVANTFAYALDIPVLAIKKEEVDKVQDLIKRFEACPAKPEGRRRGHYISATYSGEPNIGKKK